MEPVIKDAGSCGRFQTVQIFWVSVTRLASVWAGFMMIFGNYNPGWECSNGGWSRNYSSDNSSSNDLFVRESAISISLPANRTTFEKDVLVLGGRGMKNYSNSRPDVYNVSNSKDTFMTEEYFSTCDVMEYCTGSVQFDPESSTIISEFGLVCDRQWIASVILILSNTGFVLGAAVFGQLSEKFGRKFGLYASMVITTLVSGAAIFSPNWQVYAFFSFLMGFASHGILGSSFVLATEFMNSKWRGLSAARPIVSFSLCVFCISMALLKDWRHLHIATCALSFIACFGYFLVQESPRWLFVHSQNGRAEKIIQKIAKRNGKQPIDKDVIKSLIQTFERDATAQKQTYSYLDLLKGPREYKVLIMKTSINLTLNVLIYRGLSFGLTSVPGNFYNNTIISSLLQAGVLLTAGPVSNVTGRRCAGFLYSFLGAVSCGVIVVSLFVAEGYTQQIIIQISAYVARAVTQAVIGTNMVLTAEIFPTAIRSVALGFNNTVCGLGAALCAFLIPQDDDTISFAVCYAIMAFCFVFNTVTFWSLPETNKTGLHDSINST